MEHPSFASRFNSFFWHHRYVRLLFPILGLFGLTDIPKLIEKGGFPWISAVAGISAVVVVILGFVRLRRTNLKDHSECRFFYPFLSKIDKENRERFLLPRAQLLKNLDDAIISCERGAHSSHLVIVGRSGVGKSTMLSEYVDMNAIRRNIIVDPVNYVAQSLEIVIGRQKIHGDPFFQAKLVVTNSDGSDEQEFHDAVTRILDRCLTHETAEPPMIIAVDQAERLSVSMSSETDVKKRRLVSFLEAARVQTNIRIVFSVRSEYLAGILSLLPNGSYKLFFVDGIDPDHETSATSLIDKLKVFDVDEAYYRDLLKIISANGKINAFIYQLSGYLIETIGTKELMHDRNKRHRFFTDERYVVDVFIDKLLDEYGYLHSDHMKSADLEVVLFTIACFNKKTGEAPGQEEIGKIAHLSEQRLKDCASYLYKKNVIGDPENRTQKIRIAHDVLIDQLLAREPRHLRADRRIAIEQIVERRLEKNGGLVSTLDETNPFFNIIRRDEGGRADTGGKTELGLLWLLVAMYLARMAWPEIFYAHMTWVNDWLDSKLPDVVISNPRLSNVFFLPTAFTQYIWVIFMYGMNKGFFCYLYKTGEIKYSYYLLQIAGPLGALCGLFLSFAPALFIVPIAIPGLILSGVYLYLWCRSSGNTAIYKYFLELGLTTFVNMIIALLGCFLLVPAVKDQVGAQIGNVLIIYFVCILFCWFAYQMRGRQGSELGRNGMLALYDAGRRRG